MTQASPERNLNSREDPLLKNTYGPTASEEKNLSEDTSLPLTAEERQFLEHASHEAANFVAIDRHVDGFIGVLGKDLSEIQAATTSPTILVRQAEHLMEAASQLIDGAVDSKIAIRQKNQENLGEPVSIDNTNEDLKVEVNDRHKRIVDVLLANRSAREGLLQEQVNNFEISIEVYRCYLGETDPAQLLAFDAYFTPAPALGTELPTIETTAIQAVKTPSVADLEAHIEHLTDDTVSPARGITLMGHKALEKSVDALKKGWDYLVPSLPEKDRV